MELLGGFGLKIVVLRVLGCVLCLNIQIANCYHFVSCPDAKTEIGEGVSKHCSIGSSLYEIFFVYSIFVHLGFCYGPK